MADIRDIYLSRYGVLPPELGSTAPEYMMPAAETEALEAPVAAPQSIGLAAAKIRAALQKAPEEAEMADDAARLDVP